MSDKKVLLVVAPIDFDAVEFETTKKVLERRGLQVKVASTQLGTARGTGGLTARVDASLEDVKTWEYDAVIFVGGPGARRFFDDAKVTKLAKDCEYKVLGALGLAPAILASGGVLKGKRVAADTAVAGLVRQQEGRFTNQPLEVDEKLITAAGGRFAEHFGNAIVQALQK
ncbi:MAG: DJ-1/PfpI family protein [Candidatus Methylomirabilales bacterium]